MHRLNLLMKWNKDTILLDNADNYHSHGIKTKQKAMFSYEKENKRE